MTSKCFDINSNYSALLDSCLNSIKLFQSNGRLKAELIIKPRKGSLEGLLKLEFDGVRKFDFYYDEDLIFYNVERYKLMLMNDSKIYLSLDPYDEEQLVNEEDRGVVVADSLVHSVITD